MIKALKSMYNTVRQCVRYKNKRSPLITSEAGVKQGDPSSSLLFLFFVNDMINTMNADIDGIFTLEEIRFFLIMFADDSILFGNTPQALQSLLNDLEQYCQISGLKINTGKNKILIFEKGRHTRHSFSLCNKELEIVDSFKYLGTYFFKNGSWNRTQKLISQHSKFALHNLFIVFNQLDLDIKEKCKLFDSLVGSILNYNAAIWGNHDSKSIEIVHCKFLRKVLSVKKSTNLSALYGETGRYPMKIQRQLIMIKYWIKLVKTPDSLTYNVYKMLKHDADLNISYSGMNWAFYIKNLLTSSGLRYIWDNQWNTEIINYEQIKLRILDIYKQTWYADINNSNRLETYNLYKHDFNLEKYLSCIKENKFRIALTRFRLSSHDLAIETGRYTNIDRKFRICTHCNMRVIENEYHFLIVCPKYITIRQKYLKPYFFRWPTLNKFTNLMTNTSTNAINNLAKYIYFSMQERRS